MHWIYILKCKDEHYYVGETTRLYRRFWEHDDGECKNTRIFTPIGLEAIYKSDNMGNFFNYNERILSIDENLNTYHISVDQSSASPTPLKISLIGILISRAACLDFKSAIRVPSGVVLLTTVSKK